MEKHLKIASHLTHLLENRFRIFGKKFGLDPILGLIPGIGDVIPVILSFYLVWIAVRLRLPDDKIAQMIRNIVIDFFIGIIPFVGDIGDLFYKSNTKNLQIIKTYKPEAVIDATYAF